ncbi:MAG: DUF86 domain-containing protein [Bacteroidetes bacterium]|nr:DUF86 domain-containing protein [Bacteroidota bacterium]
MGLSDSIRKQHMLDAIDEALSFASGKTRTGLDADRMLVLSLIKEIEIIGEAASKISENYKANFSEVPWTDIVGMRNRLIHGYFEVDLNILWNTITKDLPFLKTKLQEITDEE